MQTPIAPFPLPILIVLNILDAHYPSTPSFPSTPLHILIVLILNIVGGALPPLRCLRWRLPSAGSATSASNISGNLEIKYCALHIEVEDFNDYQPFLSILYTFYLIFYKNKIVWIICIISIQILFLIPYSILEKKRIKDCLSTLKRVVNTKYAYIFT